MAIYYVKNAGNDSLSGTSEANAWASLAKVNASTFVAGDSILFNRGDSWVGTLTVPSSGSLGNLITFGAYGTGNKPVIHGYETISGWVSEGSGVWSKTNASWQSEMRLVTIDGAIRPKGRFPKTGYLPTTSVSGNTSVTSSLLSGSPSYVGGEVVIIKVTWIIDKGTITAHSGGTITYTGTSSTAPNTGFGFFIQNHPNCLTEIGDWRYDSSLKKLFMFFGAGVPSDYVVRVSYVPTLVNVIGKDFVKIENLSLQNAHTNSIYFQNAERNTVNTCDILKSGMYGICHYDTGGVSDNCTINGNTIEDIFDTAVFGQNVKGTIVTNNIISRTYKIPGTGNNGNSNHNAIGLGMNAYYCGSYTINNNTITDSGFNGIYTTGSNNTITKNIIDGFCQTKEDGAGMYTFYKQEDASTTLFANNLWDSNIILNGIPNGNPSPYGAIKEVYGLYFDQRARGVTASNNVIDNCYCGIFVNKANNLTIQGNKVRQVDLACILLSGLTSNTEELINNLNIQFNQLHSTTNEVLRINNFQSSISAFGTINNNYYLKPNGGVIVNKLVNWSSPASYTTIASWSAAFGYDGASLGSPTASIVSAIYYNTGSVTANISIGTSRKSITGATLTSPQSLVSFGSIMVLEGTVDLPPPTPPDYTIESIGIYTPGSGVDFLTLSATTTGALLVIMAHSYADTGTVVTPTGWTLVHTSSRNKVFTRIKQSGDSETTTFTRTGGFSYDLVYLAGFSILSSLSTLTLGALGSSNYAGSATLPSVTHPNSNHAIAIAFAGSRYSNLSEHNYSVGWTRQNRFEKTTGQTGVLSWATKELLTGGASGTAVVTNNSDMQGLILTVEFTAVVTTKFNIKLAGVFGLKRPKIKLGGVFSDSVAKMKIGGVFVDI